MFMLQYVITQVIMKVMYIMLCVKTIYYDNVMIEFFPQILEHFCPLFVQLPRWGLILLRMTPVKYPNPCSLLSRHTILSRKCGYTKHPA